MRTCPECCRSFKPRRYDQGFCSVRCSRADDARGLKRCRRLYKALYHWRLPANRRKGADPQALQDDLRFIAREIASWIEEDAEAQRLPPPRHEHSADRGHQRVLSMLASSKRT